MKTYSIDYLRYIDEAPGAYEDCIIVDAMDEEDALDKAFETFQERFGSFSDFAVNKITDVTEVYSGYIVG